MLLIAFLTGTSALAGTAQHYFPNPTIEVKDFLSSDEAACLVREVKKQGHLADSENIEFTVPVQDEPSPTGEISGINFTYCVMEGRGHADSCSRFDVQTSDPSGWTIRSDDDGDSFFATAMDMGRYARVVDATTGARQFTLDLEPCKAFFNVTD